MHQGIRDIDEIEFGIYSAEEIKNIAVCKIDSSKLCSSDKISGYGTVYDPRLGILENNKLCETCNQGIWDCPGHWGYIDLFEPIIHPLFYKQVISFLNCFCIKCYKLLISEEQINLNGFNRLRSTNRFNKILEKLEKIDICHGCSQLQPDIKYSASDNIITMNYKQKDKGKVSIVLTVDEIKKTFDNVSDKDVELLGFNVKLVHPRNLILTVFPVIPTCFVENTLIFTDNGYKFIQDVNKDDKLYSHTGNFQKINDFQIKNYSGEIIEIDVSYHANTIKCTPEHPFYVKHIDIIEKYSNINGKNKYTKIKNIGKAEWVNSKDLTEKHYIGMKKNINNIIPEFIFDKNHGNASGNQIKNIKKKLDNNDEWFLIGYYLGDGWLDFKKQGRFYLSFHDKDHDFLVNLLNKLNITYRYKEKNKKEQFINNNIIENNVKCATFECHNFILWNILKDIGHLAHNKKIPLWIHDSPNDFIQIFLDGYCLADGYHHKRNQIQYKTVSTDIAFSLQLLYIKLGKISGVHYGKIPNDTKLKDGRIISDKHRAYNISYVKERKKDLHIYLIEDDYIWFKIKKKIVSIVENIKVYNFEVDKDNSYCVENLISHNCCRPYIISDGNMCDDDLTIQIVEIIKANNHLEPIDEIPVIETKKQKYLQTLKFRIATFYNNSSGKAKHTTNGRAIKGLKERLTGKEGLVRTNLMGKRCMISGSKILFWDGTIKKVENVKIGDILIGDDGLQRKVIDKCEGEGDMYKIIQKKGEDYIVNDEHILSLKFTNTKNHTFSPSKGWNLQWFDKNTMKIQSKKFNSDGSDKTTLEEIEKFKKTLSDDNVIDISIKDYIKLPEKTKKLLFGYKLDKSIEWEYKHIEIDPYILGIWLGDGTSRGRSFTSKDKELIEYLEKWAENNNMSISKYKDGTDIHYGIKYKGKGYSNLFKEKLKIYNLVENKHIPDDYIYNDTKTRLSLLAGLIDTDGSVEQNGTTIRITQSYKHEKILSSVKFIASSLGFQTSLKNKKTSWNHNEEKKTGEALVLTISGHGIENIPTLIPHKKCKAPKNQTLTCSNITVEYYGVAKYYGFEVDDNKRFLLGDFTVAHNCEQTARTVIGPDPTLKMGQLAMPEEMAKILTMPVQVTQYNFDYLTNLISEGKVNFVKTKSGDNFNIPHHIFNRGTRVHHGDIVVRNENGEEKEIIINNGKFLLEFGDKIKRNGNFLKDIKYPEKKKYILNIGDICERQLMNGDIVLLNRQPTLHEGSMMAQEIIISPGKTLRFNLSIAKSFNADFDGDEMDL